MSKSVEPGTSGKSQNSVKTIINAIDELYELTLTMSGIENLLGIVAEAEDDGKECAAGIYLLADVQCNAVESLHKLSESLNQELSAEREAENTQSS